MYQDKLGFYRVGDLKFYSKIEAIEMHAKTGIHPHWDYNEAAFSCYDWTTEPEQNILELYRARAQQLRDKYDYLVLNFSGGADSTTVLEAFVDNDIKLDEIALHINYSATNDKEDFMNAEIFNVAHPKTQAVLDKYPYIKSRVIDLRDQTLDYFRLTNDYTAWIYELNTFMSPNAVARAGLPLRIKEWADMIHAGKKVCFISGLDKPRLFNHPDGRFSFRFLDIIDNNATVQSIAGKQPYADEFFYWSPDMPEIPIKQAHLVKNFLTDPVSLTSPFVSRRKSDLAYIVKGDTKYWLSNHGLHSIIYPKWDVGTFSVGKAESVIFSPRDQWLFNLEESHYARIGWRAGIDHLWKTLPDYWKNDPTDIAKGIKLCWSKDYFLS